VNIGPVGILSRQLHARHHSDGHVNCPDCRKAATALLGTGSGRVPRAKRAGEREERVTAHDLRRPEFVGRIVQIPGHRGYLRSAEQDGSIGVRVYSSTGVATYLASDRFIVWGP
jgi:hypothetical protein